jgi:hypothetical protein
MVRLAPSLVLALALTLGCATPTATPSTIASTTLAASGTSTQIPADGPREILLRFAQAVRAGRWAEAWPLLSERWRASTSPGRLAADWRGAGPVAREAADRVVALLDSGGQLLVAGEGRRLPVGSGRSARLVLEPAGWRVDALE